MALIAMVGLSQFADLGVAMAFQQALSEAWARGNDSELKATYSSGLRLLTYLGIAWFIGGAALAWFFGSRLLAAPNIDSHHARICWLVVATSMAAGIPFSAALRLASAIQAAWIAAFWTALCNVATVAAAWLLAKPSIDAGALGYVILLAAGQLAPGIMCALHLPRRLGWAKPFRSEPMLIRRLWRDALPFATQNLAGALLQAATPWAFARFGGYSANAAFAVLQRLFGLAQQAHALLLGPLWPAYAEAKVRGDQAWIARTFRISILLTIPVMVAVVAMATMLPRILEMWLGANALQPSPAMAWLVALWVVTAIFGQPFVLLLLGLGQIQRTSFSVMIAHVVTFAAMIGLGLRFGGVGVAAALSGGLTLGVLPLYLRTAPDALRKLPQSESTGADSITKV